VEGRSLSEVAHLAELGVNTVRAGILGLQTIRSSEFYSLLCFFAEDRVLPGSMEYGIYLRVLFCRILWYDE